MSEITCYDCGKPTQTSNLSSLTLQLARDNHEWLKHPLGVLSRLEPADVICWQCCALETRQVKTENPTPDPNEFYETFHPDRTGSQLDMEWLGHNY
jgi:hypothetical protein